MHEWRPHPKQEIALLSDSYETLYGGARGGGKTDAGQAWLLYPIEEPRYRALVIRKNYIDLNDWLDRAEVMYSGTDAKIVNRNEIRFPSGAKIVLGHLGDDKAYTKYMGHEYQRLLVEELTQIPTEELYLKLLASCRSTIPGLSARAFATCNPGGVGHTWVKKRFVVPSVPMSRFMDSVSGRTRIYIPATVDDNPTIMTRDPDYVKFLNSLPPDLRAQWRYGSWDDFKMKGAIFADEMYEASTGGRICVVALTPNVPVYTAWDLGINDDQVCWFFQVVGDQIKIVDLIKDSDKGFDYYIRLLKDKNYYYGKAFLPHDGAKRSPDSLRSFEDVLKGAGFDTKVLARTIDKKRDIQQARIILHRCWFDSEKCAAGIDALTQYRRRWIEEKNSFEDDPYHDWTSHYADSFMQMAVAVNRMGANTAMTDYKKAHDDLLRSTAFAPRQKTLLDRLDNMRDAELSNNEYKMAHARYLESIKNT